MKRWRDKKGFTLVELIVVLVILAILAAILIPSMVGWIKKGEEKSCMSALGGIKRSYLAGAAMERYQVEDPDAVLDYAVKEWGGVGATSGTTFKCPCGNDGVVTYSADNAAILTIACSVHGTLGGNASTANVAEDFRDIWSDKGIANNPNNPNSLSSIADYFASRKKAGEEIDSEGYNWGQKITALLSQKFNLDMSTSLWRISRLETNVNKFEIVWTAPNTKDTAAGTEIDVTRVVYDKDSNTISEAETAKKVVGTKPGDSGKPPYTVLEDEP